jgi:TGF-beta receptor type-1
MFRSDGSCAVGDLGLAVRYNGETNEIDVPHTARVGTKRYLAPEILSDALNPADFEAFKRSDIYSLGLIFWELSSRCQTNNAEVVPEYRLPYHDLVSPDPAIEEMRKVVCGDGARPELPDHWTTDKGTLLQMAKLMAECCYENPNSRLTALRVKKTLASMKMAAAAAAAVGIGTALPEKQ